MTAGKYSVSSISTDKKTSLTGNTIKERSIFLAERLTTVAHTEEQYKRNLLFREVFIALVSKTNSLNSFETQQLRLGFKSLVAESRKYNGLFPYLRLILLENKTPLSMQKYKRELVSSLYYLIGDRPQLEAFVNPNLVTKAETKARADINIYLSGCVNKLIH